MGIKDLKKVITKGCYGEVISLDEIKGWRIAIDLPIYLHKYVKISEKWEDRLIELVKELRKRFIKPVFVFEGKNVPVEKSKEREKRRKDYDNQKKKYETLCSMKIRDNEETRDSLVKLFPKTKIPTNVYSLRKFVDDKKIKMGLQVKIIDDEIIDRAKDVLGMLGMSIIQADGEAETLCVDMCYSKKVDAMLTGDTDVLAYKGGENYDLFLLMDIDLFTSSVMFISKKQMLSEMELDEDEFRDFCILLGCDYNTRIEGFGAKKSLDCIEEYKSIEKMIEDEKITREKAVLTNYEKCRELFACHETDIFISMNKALEEEKLECFLKEIDSRYKIENIISCWVSNNENIHYVD